MTLRADLAQNCPSLSPFLENMVREKLFAPRRGPVCLGADFFETKLIAQQLLQTRGVMLDNFETAATSGTSFGEPADDSPASLSHR